MAVSPEVRDRVLATLYSRDRDLAWMSRVVGKSKGWGTAFKHGTGSLNHAEMRRLAKALEVSEEYLWDGVTPTVTDPGKDEAPQETPMTILTGTEQMIIAIYRELAPQRQHVLMDLLTRLLREQTHLPPTKETTKR